MQDDKKSNTLNDDIEEQLACFKLEDHKYFHTGMLSHYVYPMSHSKAHDDDIPHIIIRLFAKTLDGKYLVQKRSKKKKHHKGRWTDSASGHVRCSKPFKYEDIEKTVERELSEEMGCNLLDLRFYKMHLANIGIDKHELNYIYVGIVDEKLNTLNDEVNEESGFYSESELINLLKLPEVIKTKKKPAQKTWVEISKEIWKVTIDGELDYLFNDMAEEINNSSQNNNELTDKLTTGLLIGRFQPLHLGHMYLIEKSLDYVTNLKIGIGSSQFSDKIDNPLSYDERKLFLDLSMADINIPISNYNIFPIPDQFDFKKWIDFIIKTVGDFDVIFTNNLWIGRIFQLHGKKLIYGLKFNFEIYNGTKIRNLIYKEKAKWTVLVPKSVRRYISEPEILKRLKKISKNKK